MAPDRILVHKGDCQGQALLYQDGGVCVRCHQEFLTEHDWEERLTGAGEVRAPAGGDSRFTSTFVLSVFSVLEHAGYRRGSDEAVGGAIHQLEVLCRTYEGREV